jgi:hypothetical protein
LTTVTAIDAAALARDRLYQRLIREIGVGGVPTGPGDQSTVTEAEVSRLPDVVQRYLRFMGVVGRPRIWSLRARFVGRFRLRPRLGWMPAEAWQYNSSLGIARVFVMRLRFAGFVPMVGSDTYLRGHGRMLGKLLDRVTVADGKGDEFDIGELTTYLNDAILLAPSMLLGSATSWNDVDGGSFDVSLADGGRSVRGRVFVDARGAPYDFSTTDRYADLPGGLTRAEWHTPVTDWDVVDGRAVPGRFGAVWHLPHGQLPYITGGLTHLSYNVTIGEAVDRTARGKPRGRP